MKSAFESPDSLRALRCNQPRVQSVYPNLAWTELFGKRNRQVIDRTLRGRIDRTIRRWHRSYYRANVDHRATVAPNELNGFLRSEKKAENIQVELAMEFLGRDIFYGTEAVDAGVIDKYVQSAVLLLDLDECSGDVVRLRKITLYRSGLASCSDYLCYSFVRAGLASGIVDDDICSRSAEVFGY